MYKISVIIPIFNSESTIERAILSFLNQKWDGDFFDDLELILVDNCSTDKTKEIIDQYSKKYSNVHAYSTEKNSGSPSKPRNIGINKSNSKYLMFMDSDDAYCEDMCQKLYETIIREKVDVVSCNFYNVFSSGCQKVFYYKEIPEYEVKGDSMFLDSCNSMLSSNIVVWNKIFDKSLITKNNIKFPYKVSEDIFFCWEFFSHMDKMLFLTDYFGVKRYMYSESYSHSADVNNVINTIRSTRELDEKLVNEYIDFNKYPKFRFSFSASSIEFILMRISFLTETESIRLCLNELYEYEKEILFDNSLNNKLYKFINFFILKNKLSFATFIFNLMNFVKNSKVLSTIIKKLIAIK